MTTFRSLAIIAALAACRPADAPKPTTAPPDSTAHVLRTYQIPTGQQKTLERLLRGNSYPITVTTGDKVVQTQFVRLNPQFTGDGYFILSAPIGIHEGVRQLIDELKTRPPTTGPTSIETTYWLVLGTHAAKTDIPASLAAITPALEGLHDLGAMKFEPYEIAQITALDGDEARSVSNRAEIKQTASADKDSIDLRLELKVMGVREHQPDVIETSVRVKQGQFAVLGQAGFKPEGSYPPSDDQTTLFYVVRTRPAA